MRKKILELDHCDVIKVFMMLSVMFYHCICLWSKGGWFNQPPAQSSQFLAFLCAWLNSFHIYVFTFVSGYLFFYLKYEKQKYNSFLKDALHRGKRLLIPYICASVFWVIPFYVHYNSPKTLTVVKNFALAISPNQLWFLVMIFMVFVIFYLLSNVFEKYNIVVGFLLSVAIYGISWVGAFIFPNLFQIWTAGKYIFFYYMGFAFRKYRDNILYKIPWICYFVVHIALLSVHFFYVSNKETTFFKLSGIALSPVISTFGVLMVVVGLSKFKYVRLKENKVFLLLSKHNFFMYLVHQQIIYVVISLLNNRVSTPLLVLLNFVVSFSISLLFGVLISKIPIVKKAFGYK